MIEAEEESEGFFTDLATGLRQGQGMLKGPDLSGLLDVRLEMRWLRSSVSSSWAEGDVDKTMNVENERVDEVPQLRREFVEG